MQENSYAHTERRKSPRLRLRLAVVYQINKPLSVRMQVGDKEILSTALDLSEGGISITTNYNIPLQTELLIKFTLFKVDEDSRVSFYGPMEIIGEVRSNTPIEKNAHRLGICFVKIDEKDRAEIVNFVKVALES